MQMLIISFYVEQIYYILICLDQNQHGICFYQIQRLHKEQCVLEQALELIVKRQHYIQKNCFIKYCHMIIYTALEMKKQSTS